MMMETEWVSESACLVGYPQLSYVWDQETELQHFLGERKCAADDGKKRMGGEGGRVQRELRIVGKIYSLPQQQWTPLP